MTDKLKVKCLLFFLIGLCFSVHASGSIVQVSRSDQGLKLIVDGKEFLIKGMNWDHYPIGTNYSYSLWDQPEATIQSVLDHEMPFLKDMGVNALRIHSRIPRKWIAYIYEQFDIYTVLNHSFGRYGLEKRGEWIANTNYDDPDVQTLLLKEVTALAQAYHDTPGLLLYLLGNENNYGLFWEDKTPTKDTQQNVLVNRALYKLFLHRNGQSPNGATSKNDQQHREQVVAARALAMYELFNEAAKSIKQVDNHHPVAICNGDLMFIDLIKETCTAIDIFGTNIYRGISFGDTFQRVKLALDIPVMFTEVGADAYNSLSQAEDQDSQAYYLLGNWKEIYANTAGIGGTGNAIGGFTYQFSDTWWKSDENKNLSIHDTSASWNNGGYYRDEKDGVNNMNEEWFGICAKEPVAGKSTYVLKPRAAYFMLKEAHDFSPYKPSTTLINLENHFSAIELKE